MRASGILLIAFLALVVAFCLTSFFVPTIHAASISAVALVVVTSIYSLLAFFSFSEARRSTDIMAKTLRFSNSASLSFFTAIDDNPELANFTEGTVNVDITPEYKNAKALYEAQPGNKEFVLACIRNSGRGSALDIDVSARYEIVELGRGPHEVTRRTSLGVLEPHKCRFFFIHCFNSVTPEDRVSLLSAELRYTDAHQKSSGTGPNTQTVGGKDSEYRELTSSLRVKHAL